MINRGIAVYADPEKEMEIRKTCKWLLDQCPKARVVDLEAEILKLYGRETTYAVLGREP